MDEIQAKLQDPLLKRIVALLPPEIPIYLVGGGVRDILLNKPGFDLDFVTSGDAMKIARQLADALGGAYFPLDARRNVARIVLKNTDDEKNTSFPTKRVDIAKFQGPDLVQDLMGRDFTFNALAVHIQDPTRLIDPTGGVADLLSKQLKACSQNSFLDDPVRILRAVRFCVNLGLSIHPDTVRLIKEATVHLPEVSAERLRDELFRMLVLPHPAACLRILDKLGALDTVLPEVSALKLVQQSTPHVADAWNHTLDTLNRLESIFEVLAPQFNPDKASNLALGMVALQLGRYREQLSAHLNNALNPERPHRGLIYLAGLYHDVGKQNTQSIDEHGKTHFIGHEQIGSKLAENRGFELKLSNLEISRLVTIVNNHMRPSLLSHPPDPPTNKAIYRFFKDTGAAGIDVCLLSLADLLATYGATLPTERWNRHLMVVRALFHAWWEKPAEQVLPVALINGEDLISEFNLQSGPIFGYVLEAVREAQVTGEVNSRNEALQLAKEIIAENLSKKTG